MCSLSALVPFRLQSAALVDGIGRSVPRTTCRNALGRKIRITARIQNRSSTDFVPGISWRSSSAVFVEDYRCYCHLRRVAVEMLYIEVEGGLGGPV